MIDRQIGPYQVLAKLGEGGMGEVYRARDVKLDRDVAIKVLPDVFAADPERVARFEREAKALAALNHPHIAQIHGVEEQDGARALVMELVDGETLADRLTRGAIPLDEAVPIAQQIAAALDAAHECGIVHRDLKPANIKLRPDGTTKVLDFGLAKALDPASGRAEPGSEHRLANSPTITSPLMTHAGVILGTAAYMSPEQAKGRPVDRRADIWAFGCVVFEMLTARQPFSGETVTDVLARVIEREPDWTLLPRVTPPALRRMLQRCLEKNPAKRWHHMRDVALELDLAATERAHPEASIAAPRTRWREVAGWLVASVAIVLAAVSWSRTPDSPTAAVTDFELRAPEGVLFGMAMTLPNAALAPDGRSFVFEAGARGAPSRLWIRAFDDGTARELPNTEDATLPFWSPDGRSIAFSKGGRLYRTDVGSGSPQVVSDLPDGAEGGAWGENGTILFGSFTSGIYRVSAAGGVAQALTTPAAGEMSHHWPVWLPGEQHYLYRTESGSVFRASLDGAAPRKVMDADSRVEFVPPGLLLFAKGTSLVAQPFDPQSGDLTGEPSIISESVRLGPNGRAMFSAKPDALIFRSGAVTEVAFTWDVYDQRGQVLQSLPLKILRSFALSPDGRQVAVHTHEQGTGDGELSIVQLAGGGVTRIEGGSKHYDYPIWSPDGTRLAIISNNSISLIRPDGAVIEDLPVPLGSRPTDWTARGDWLVYHDYVSGTDDDIWALPLSGDRKPRAVVQTRAAERNGVVSPDGQWLAYTSFETGRAEVYVQRFPAGGNRTRISVAGGGHARWDPTGTALYFWSADERVMRVPVRLQDDRLQAGEPTALLSLRNTSTQFGIDRDRSPYVLGPDGLGFIGAQGDGPEVDSILRVVLNWRERLGR
jgi:Tol biopolymer transport system component